MQKKSMNFVKGMGIGLAVGAVAATAGRMAVKNHSSLSKTTSKAFKAVGDFVDGVQTLIK